MSAVRKKKLMPASNAAGTTAGSPTMPRQNGLTSSPLSPSGSRSVSFGSSARGGRDTAALVEQRLGLLGRDLRLGGPGLLGRGGLGEPLGVPLHDELRDVGEADLDPVELGRQ